MKKYLWLGIVLLMAASVLKAQDVPASIDGKKIAEHIRSAVSVPLNWTIEIKNIQPSELPNLYEGQVVFTLGQQNRTQKIVVSSDGAHYILGDLLNTNVDLDRERMAKMNLKSAPYKGPKEAPIVLVEYSDFQCPSCKIGHESMKSRQILETYPNQLRLVWKNYPLESSHPWAKTAAIAGICAAEQSNDAFWKMADYFFANQSSITVQSAAFYGRTIAKMCNLKLDAFDKCVASPKTLDKLNADIAEGKELGVFSTPTFFLQGRTLVGVPSADVFHQYITYFLNQPSAEPPPKKP